MNRPGIVRAVLSLVAGVAAFAGALAITEPLGPGLDPDGMAYVHAASSLVGRGSLRDVRDEWMPADSERTLTRWPPGFPIAIAAPVAAGAPAVQGARLVMALSAFAAMVTLTWLVSGAASLAAAAVLAVLLLVTPAIVYVHESILSEPLFLAMLAATLALMVRERAMPFAEGCAAAAASMVRYAGLAAVGTVVLWELARGGSWRTRIQNAALATLPALIVNGWWWTRAAHAGGRGAVRDFSIYGQLGETLREGTETTAAWLAPATGLVTLWAGAAVAGVLLLTLIVGARRIGRAMTAPARTLLAAAALLTAAYLGLVLTARVLADPQIPLDPRILAPAIMMLTVMLAVAGDAWWRDASIAGGVIAVVALLAWSAGALLDTRDAVRYALNTGSDYADQCWRGSPVTAWVREHGAGHPLVSNASVALYFHAGRLAREMPDALRPADARAFGDTLAARDAYLVLFDQSCAASIDQPDSLVRALGLVREAQLSRGSIWRAAPDSMRRPPATLRPPAVPVTR